MKTGRRDFPPSHLLGCRVELRAAKTQAGKMKRELVVFLLCLVLLATETAANPVIGEKFAKQLLRSKRQDRPVKAGHPDEPMRVRSICSACRRLTRGPRRPTWSTG
ncbi:uncharacterized protein C17orf67 homolog isoform X2 [Poecilia reticulata]|uniref:uncharacterized protein C17orf67 homolog isoform X2 n=1 Tax=Poecilia reticulata TaxID=8081 RepID=UPI0007EA7D5F|nr:PREDICTED: uncharacterized protein C17orf67 homolog isoform X2 [Poecilia reticulata]